MFKSTIFGDDVDRPLQKADGTWTYFAGDVAYHSNKISRKFDVLINILGAALFILLGLGKHRVLLKMPGALLMATTALFAYLGIN